MRELAHYILLGLLQGATEFLPVSSSGHLVAAKELLGAHPPGMLLETCLHFGTLLAILIVFHRDIWRLLVDALKGVGLLLRGRKDAISEQAPMFRMALAILVGSIPAGTVGLLFHDAIAETFGSLRLASAMLFVTGLLLLSSKLAPRGAAKDVSPLRGLLIGIAQAAALLPGISRSASTIVTGHFLGVERGLAARFSFLLAVPALAGAMALEIVKALSDEAARAALTGSRTVALACGTATAALVGWVCLVLLLKLIEKGKLHWFGAYCVPLGLILFALSF